MNDQQIITRFNPNNTAQLTPEELEVMRNLTDDQINKLAEAYPNQPTRRAYIKLYDKNTPAHKQMYQLSTWQNLRNIRKYSNQKNLIPWDFKGFPQPVTRQAVQREGGKKVIVDMSAQEAAAELKQSIKQSVEKPVNSPTKKSKVGEQLKSAIKSKKANVPADQQFDAGQ